MKAEFKLGIYIASLIGWMIISGHAVSPILENKYQECRPVLASIDSYYKTMMRSEELHMKYQSYSLIGNESSASIETEIISKSGFLSFKNDFIQVWQDRNHNVMILESQKQVIIRNASEFGSIDKYKKSMIPKMDNMTDSLLEKSKTVTCDASSLTLSFDATIAGEEQPIKLVVIGFGESGQITYTKVDYFENEKVSSDIFEFDIYRYKAPTNWGSGSALARVIQGTKLLGKYSDYQLIDLRQN